MTYITLTCAQCSNTFVWSEEEQHIYQQRELPPPRYCPICRGMMEARERDNKRSQFEKNHT